MDLQTSFVSGYRLIDGGETLSLKNAVESATTGIVPNPAGAQATAVPLTAHINEITSAVLNAAVMLPAAVPGLSVVVVNDSAVTIQVFANPANPNNNMQGDTIVGAGVLTTANVTTIATGVTARFYAMSLNRWKQTV